MNAGLLKINIDGASKGNPGGSGIGVVIRDRLGAEVKRLGEHIGTATNNVAEYTALIYALQEALMLGAESVEVFSDSELLVRQVNGEYAVRNEELKRLFRQFRHLASGFSEVKVRFVAREGNKDADMLASRAADERL